jgi:HSP20 family protein
MSTKKVPEAPKSELAPKTTDPYDLFTRFEKFQQSIAERAFDLFRSRGGREGFDVLDWLRAEAEFLRPVPVDMVMNDAEVLVTAEVPGFAAKDLDIVVEPTRLTIQGKRDESTEKTEGERTISERSSNEILRCLSFPAEVDPSTATASLANGEVKLTIKRALAKEPVKVQVKGA